jgi:hypothetical protein
MNLDYSAFDSSNVSGNLGVSHVLFMNNQVESPPLQPLQPSTPDRDGIASQPIDADHACVLNLVKACRAKKERVSFLVNEIRETQLSLDEATSHWSDIKSKVDALLNTFVPDEESSSDIPTIERDLFYAKVQKRIDAFMVNKHAYLKDIEPERDTLVHEISTLTATLQMVSRDFGGGDGQIQCSVCYDGPADIVIHPCYHVFCEKCVERIITERCRCPTCRTTIVGSRKLYF